MPYEIAFTKSVPIADRSAYFNDCCVGGDVVMDRLLPAISQRYSGVQANQEDWGWFIWFRAGGTALAIDVFCDDPDAGAFRLHLTSRRKRWLFSYTIVDSDELDKLRQLVESELADWVGQRCRVKRLDARYAEVRQGA